MVNLEENKKIRKTSGAKGDVMLGNNTGWMRTITCDTSSRISSVFSKYQLRNFSITLSTVAGFANLGGVLG